VASNSNDATNLRKATDDRVGKWREDLDRNLIGHGNEAVAADEGESDGVFGVVSVKVGSRRSRSRKDRFSAAVQEGWMRGRGQAFTLREATVMQVIEWVSVDAASCCWVVVLCCVVLWSAKCIRGELGRYCYQWERWAGLG